MNQEVNDFLRENLLEAHIVFNTIIKELKDNNIELNYNEMETKELEYYRDVIGIMNKMNYFVSRKERLKEDNVELFNTENRYYVIYSSLYVVTMMFIKLFYEIFDASKLNDMVKSFFGLFLGGTYMYLFHKDFIDNRSSTKERRDLINELKTLKEEYKKNHDIAVSEIDSIFAMNSSLWSRLDKEKIKTSYIYLK